MRRTISAAAIAAVVLAAGYAQAQVCGDVTDNGKVTTTDALSVLQTAVGLDVPLICDTGDCSALENRMDALEDETLVLTDGNGNVFGRIVMGEASKSHYRIFVKSIGKLLSLAYNNKTPGENEIRKIDASSRSLFYTEPNCQGTPFLGDPSYDFDVNAIVTDGSGRYFVTAERKSLPFTVRSSGDAISCSAVNSTYAGKAAYNLREVLLPFELPAPGPFQIKPLR